MQALTSRVSDFFKSSSKQQISVKCIRNENKILMEGWLRKRSSNKFVNRAMASMNMKWQNFYVILTQDSIVYFKSEEEKKCAGKVFLYGYNAVSAIKSESNWHENSFRVNHACSDLQNKTLYFAAQNPSGRKKWMSKVREALLIANEEVISKLRSHVMSDDDIELPIYEESDFTRHNSDANRRTKEEADIASDDDDYCTIPDDLDHRSMQPKSADQEKTNTLSSESSSTYHDPDLCTDIKQKPLPLPPIPKENTPKESKMKMQFQKQANFDSITREFHEKRPAATHSSKLSDSDIPMIPPRAPISITSTINKNLPDNARKPLPLPVKPSENKPLPKNHIPNKPLPVPVKPAIPEKPSSTVKLTIPEKPSSSQGRPVMSVKPTLSPQTTLDLPSYIEPQQPLYWPGEKAEALRLLKFSSRGTFMIRESDREPGSMVLMVSDGSSHVFSVKIYEYMKGQYSLKPQANATSSEIFRNLEDLVSYYHEHYVLLKNGQLELQLIHAHMLCRHSL